jgi:hypothetical protein
MRPHRIIRLLRAVTIGLGGLALCFALVTVGASATLEAAHTELTAGSSLIRSNFHSRGVAMA